MTSRSGDRARAFPAIERAYGRPVQHWFDLLAQSEATKYDAQMALLQERHGFSRAHANAVVMTHRGSPTTRRFATPEDYFDSLDQVKAATARSVFACIREGRGGIDGLELVVAWNQPILKAERGYVFGLSAARSHLTLNPFSAAVISEFADRLAGLKVGKRTFSVPADWKADRHLLRAMVRARQDELT